MNALVFGNGESGKAAAELLRRAGACVAVLDGEAVFPEGTWDLAVTSPGVPLDHPWQAAARARGVRVVSELQLGVERARARGARLLGVTGSKGKSSVVKLCADALGGVPCGNYGRPVCAVVNEEAAPSWLVVEASSFQLETTELPPDAFAAAALLNLQDDHLDRHGSREVYHALKRRLLGFAAVAIDGMCAAAASADDALFAGSYFDNTVLAPNARCAVALLRAAGLDDAEIAAAFARFVPLAHRFETVCVRGGVRWVDDSKATSLAALGAGISMACGASAAPNCRLIAGGLAKGDDPKSVVSLLQSGVKKVYLIGRCAEVFFDAWHSVVPCEKCGTLEVAVAATRRDACAGETVLLSPGTASFDQFTGYGARGDAFAALAKKEEER